MFSARRRGRVRGDHDSAVIDLGALPKRRAHDQDGHEPGRRLHHRGQGALSRVKKRVLQQKVLNCVSRKAEFGKYRHGDRFFMARACCIYYRGRIGVGLATLETMVQAATRAKP